MLVIPDNADGTRAKRKTRSNTSYKNYYLDNIGEDSFNLIETNDSKGDE